MIEIFEVGPRDGLQNDPRHLKTADKIWLVRSLLAAGVRQIEAGSLVRPDRVPQMADSAEVFQAISQHADFKKPEFNNAAYWFLVPNQKGFDRAVQLGIKHIALFTAVSNTFNQKNIGMTVDESFQVIESLTKQARQHGMKVRGYVSTVWGCPFEMKTDPKQAIAVIERMCALDIDQVSIGDTIGVAAPTGVEAVLRPLLANLNKVSHKIAVHFHDTRGTALVNTLKAYELGVRSFDASIGGLGGCPFAPGAAGNLATEDLLYLFKEMGIPTGIDYAKFCHTALELNGKMNGQMNVSGDTGPRMSKALSAFSVNCMKNNAWDI